MRRALSVPARVAPLPEDARRGRLREVGARTGGQAREDAGRQRLAREEDDRDGAQGEVRANALDHREAVQVRHRDVRDDEIGRRLVVGPLAPVEAVDGKPHRVGRGKDEIDGLAHVAVIIDDEDALATQIVIRRLEEHWRYTGPYASQVTCRVTAGGFQRDAGSRGSSITKNAADPGDVSARGSRRRSRRRSGD